MDSRTVGPGRFPLLSMSVAADLPERMRLRGLDVERVLVFLIVRLADDPAGLPREADLDFPEPTVFVLPAPAGSLGAVLDGLPIVIGRVIRVVLDEPAVQFDLAVEDFGATVALVDFLVIVAVGRRMGAAVVVLFDDVGDCLVVVVVDRLFIRTGRVMRVVLDGLKVLFELVVGDLYVLGVERLLTLTDPGVVLGLTVILRLIDEEVDDFGVGETGREVPRLLEGVRLGVYLVGARLGVVLDGVRLGVLLTEDRLGVVRLGVLLTEDRLGAVRLGVLLLDDGREVVPPDGREVDLGVLLEVLRVETREAVEVDGALAAGFGLEARAGVGLGAAFGVALTMGLVAAGFGAALTMGLVTAGFGVALTTGLVAAGFGVALTTGLGGVALAAGLGAGLDAAFGAGLGVALTMGLETAGFGVDFTMGLETAGFGLGFATGLGAGAFAAGLGLAFGAGLGAALGAGLGFGLGAGFGAGAFLGAAFAWGAAGLLLGFSAKAGATQVIIAKANVISRTFASCCNLMIDMIGLLSSLSEFFTCQDS